MVRSAYDRHTGQRTITVDGGRLRELRASQSLSLSDVAARTGLSIASVSALEREVWIPSQQAIGQLQSLYGDALTSSGAITLGA